MLRFSLSLSLFSHFSSFSSLPIFDSDALTLMWESGKVRCVYLTCACTCAEKLKRRIGEKKSALAYMTERKGISESPKISSRVSILPMPSENIDSRQAPAFGPHRVPDSFTSIASG